MKIVDYSCKTPPSDIFDRVWNTCLKVASIKHKHAILNFKMKPVNQHTFSSSTEYGWYRWKWPSLSHTQPFQNTVLAFSQSGTVIKYLVQLKFIYYHRPGNKNVGQGVCKFGTSGKWKICCVQDNGQGSGDFEEFQCKACYLI